MALSVLFIDDDPVLQKIAAAALQEYDVTGVTSGEEGLTLSTTQSNTGAKGILRERSCCRTCVWSGASSTVSRIPARVST